MKSSLITAEIKERIKSAFKTKAKSIDVRITSTDFELEFPEQSAHREIKLRHRYIIYILADSELSSEADDFIDKWDFWNDIIGTQRIYPEITDFRISLKDEKTHEIQYNMTISYIRTLE
jgi:hypothetical protein